MSENMRKMKYLQQLVKTLEKVDYNTDDVTYGVCSNFIRKITDYLFTMID